MGAHVVPTQSPTKEPFFFLADDDGELDLISDVMNLDWNDIVYTGVTVAIFAVLCVLFFEYARRRSDSKLIFCPRRRLSKEAVQDWFRSTSVSDERLLEIVGLEMYTFLRFVRVCRAVCAFGCLSCVLVLVPVYGTVSGEAEASYPRSAWYRFTLANVDAASNKGRLWAPAVLIYAVSLQLAYVCYQESQHFSKLRFDSWVVSKKQEQALRTVVLKRLPLHLRRSDALLSHLASLFGPNQVHSASVPMVAPSLEDLNSRREAAVLRLERLLVGRGESIPAVKAELSRLNADCRTLRTALLLKKQDDGASTGFVTFYRLTTTNMVRQMQFAARPLGLEAEDVVPVYEDILWRNVSLGAEEVALRSCFTTLIVYALALSWTAVISGVYALATLRPPNNLRKKNPIVIYVYAVLPVMLLSLLLTVLPFVLSFVSEHFEGLKFASQVQLATLRRNFAFQMVNLWWSVVAGSIWDILTTLLRNPSRFFALLGTAMPLVSAYFVMLLLIRTGALFWELSRAWPYLRRWVQFGETVSSRDKSNGFLRPHFFFEVNYVSVANVAIVALLFSVLAPLVYPFALLYTHLALLVYTHQALHVYVPRAESGGIFFEPMLNQLLKALILVQCTVTAFLLFKFAWIPAALTSILPVATYAAGEYGTSIFHGNSKAALELTLAKDKEQRQVTLDPLFYTQPCLKEGDLQPNDPNDDNDSDDESESGDDHSGDQKPPPPDERSGLLSSNSII